MIRIPKMWPMIGITLFMCSLMACGGGGAASTSATETDVHSLDGATGVAVDTTFVYSFSQPVDAATVTKTSYFIRTTPTTAPASSVKAELNAAICDPAEAMDATVTCSSTTRCALDPASDLAYDTSYTVCLTTDIMYASGDPFEGFMAQFTTESTSASTEDVTISSAQLVRLDGTELDFSARPIPRMVGISFVLSHALAESTDRTAFENAIALTGADSSAVAGAFIWAEDYASVMFMPDEPLAYGTTYSVEVGTLPTVNVASSVDTDALQFTTLIRNDVNGDGYADVIVGAQRHDSFRGRAYIFFGSADGLSDCSLGCGDTADATFTGTAIDEFTGSSVHIGGDFNADGYEDILVGAYPYAPNGRAFIFHGAPSLGGELSPSATLTGPVSDSYFGFAVAAADVNGDGLDDVIVGAPNYQSASGNPGAAFIFHGAAGGIPTHDLAGGDAANASLYGAANNDYLGVSLDGAGDVNADGYDDVIIGADFADGGYGHAYIFHGSNSGIADCDLSVNTCYQTILRGASTSDNLGKRVAGAGDIDGDGYDDVTVAGLTLNDKGRVDILRGSAAGIADCDLEAACSPWATITGAAADDRLGQALHGGGDVNSDGYPDIVAGAPETDSGGTERGEAYLFLGGPSLTGSLTPSDATSTVSGSTDNEELGYNVMIAGDINADGYDDMLVGAPKYGGGQGIAYYFQGPSTGTCDLSGSDCYDANLLGQSNDFFGILRNQQ